MEQFNLGEMPDITFEGVEMNKPTNDVQVVKESTFNEKNYLNVKLADGEKSKTLHIRLLPMDLETGNPFFLGHQHNVKVPVDVAKSGYKTYICPSRTNVDHTKYGGKCPFCEINQDAYHKAQAEKDPLKKKQWTDLSIKYMAKPFAVCRCIDRDDEASGVKFWKINISRKEDDAYNQIMNLYNLRRAEGKDAGQDINILSLKTGYDLIISISEGGENTFGNAIKVSDAKFSTPLTNNPEQWKSWVYDDKKWLDVFAIKPYDYLSIICAGESPWFDRQTKSWVSKKDYDNAVADKKAAMNASITEAEAGFQQPQAPAPQSFMQSLEVNLPNNDDDLPY